MPFFVDEFRASLNARGVLKSNRFMVTFNLPPAFDGDPLEQYYQSLCRDSQLWCDGASIPGIFLQTMKFRRYGYGALDTVPLVPVFNDVQLRFIADGNADNWGMFQKWINKVSNSDSSGGIWNAQTESVAGQPLYPYEVAWQNELVTSVFVSVYGEDGTRVKDVNLNQAYPTAISDIKLDWGDNGDVARFIVNFTIQDWQSSHVGDFTPPGQ